MILVGEIAKALRQTGDRNSAAQIQAKPERMDSIANVAMKGKTPSRVITSPFIRPTKVPARNTFDYPETNAMSANAHRQRQC